MPHYLRMQRRHRRRRHPICVSGGAHPTDEMRMALTWNMENLAFSTCACRRRPLEDERTNSAQVQVSKPKRLL